MVAVLRRQEKMGLSAHRKESEQDVLELELELEGMPVCQFMKSYNGFMY